MSVVLLTPHAGGSLDAGRGYFRDDPEVQAALPERFDDWIESGAGRAAAVAGARLGVPVLGAELGRDVIDLGRPWRAEPAAVETLFSKHPVDRWARERLRPGAFAELEARYRRQLAEVRAATRDAQLVVEVHEYGTWGSSYDQAGAERRPCRRAMCALIPGGPWATSDLSVLTGVERLLPAHLGGAPWPLELAVVTALTPEFRPGPSPYPTRAPWALSCRAVAGRFFRWLGDTGRLAAETAAALEDRAWGDPFADDATALPGAAELASQVNAWAQGPDLVDLFQAETGFGTMVVELRLDQRGRAELFGERLAVGISRWWSERT